jgi:putative ABC transport system permease protein
MKLTDILRLSLNSLTHRGLRSWLTILGIIIGVAAVIAMLSIGQGMSQNIQSRMGGFGADVLTVSAGQARAFGPEGSFNVRFEGGSPSEGSRGDTSGSSSSSSSGSSSSSTTSPTLTDTDLNAVLSADGVKAATGIISGRAEVSYLSKSVTTTVEGIDPTVWNTMTTSEISSGRLLESGDGMGVLIGSRVATETFDSNITVDSQILVGGKTFTVVGILKESGTGGFGSDDRTIFMTISSARDILTSIDQSEYSSIQVKVESTDLVDATITSVTNELLSSRDVTSDTQDFTVTSPTSMLETITSTMQTMTFFLTGIAAVSLLVGAIGIANTMFMSVMERTRLIGILKSLGTKNSEIMKLFVAESGIIGLTGGLLGVFLGFIVVGIISEIGFNLMGLGAAGRMAGGTSASVAVVTPELVFFALAFSTIIGIVSGLIPARKAANLEVVEAMRSE